MHSDYIAIDAHKHTSAPRGSHHAVKFKDFSQQFKNYACTCIMKMLHWTLGNVPPIKRSTVGVHCVGTLHSKVVVGLRLSQL